MIAIPFGNHILVLEQDEFDRAAEHGRQQFSAAEQPRDEVPGDEQLLTADQAAELASVPKQWLLEAARQKRIPHYRLGKYVRFRLSELRAATRRSGDQKQIATGLKILKANPNA